MKRIVLDQGLPWSTASILNDQGWDAIHVRDAGLTRSSDIEILEYARKSSRVCITLDADFHSIIAIRGESSPSVVRIRIEGLKAENLARLLIMEWPNIDQTLDLGALVTITEKNVRLRQLPIR